MAATKTLLEPGLLGEFLRIRIMMMMMLCLLMKRGTTRGNTMPTLEVF